MIRTIVDKITAPALVVGADLRVKHVNARMCDSLRDLSLRPADLALQDLVAPADWPAALAWINPAGMLSQDTGCIINMPDTGNCLTITAVTGPSGDRIGYLGVVTDSRSQAGHQAQRWQSILANLDDGIWDYDAVTGTRFRSNGWRRLRGLAIDDVSRDRREDWIRYVHPDHHAELAALNQQLMSGQCAAYEVTYRERHAKGHWMWITSNGRVAQFAPDGSVRHIIGNNRDVTDIREAEDKLRQLEKLRERWRFGVESAGQGLWDHNLVTGERYCSDIWRGIRGYAPDEHVRETASDWFTHVHPDDQQRLRNEIAAIDNRESDEIRYEYRERHKDGHYVWILSRGRVLLRKPDGKPAHIIGNDTDITEIKVRSEEIDSLSKTLELAVTTAGIGVWEYNLDTRVSKWDAQMCKIYGLEASGPLIIGDSWEKHLHPEDFAAATQEAERCLATGEEFNQDYRIVRPDKTIRHVRSRAAQFVDSAGMRRVIGVNWDITEDRQRAEVLRQANALAQDQNRALEEARAKMEHSALHDALTGLANRRKLDSFEESVRGKAAVLHIDLDRFKQINDTLGHATGDKVIVHAANILRAAAPQGALVSRVGGDEFVILLPETPSHCELEELASRIISDASKPVQVNGNDCRFGMSVGIAVSREGEIGSTLFANADMALYLAKNDGRGRYKFYTEDLKIALQTKNRLADEILAGLQNNEFFCVYQPQFDACTLDLSGVEALVRWRHPDGSIRGPDGFLPVAEELNVVSQIDQLVLDQAIADTLFWQRAGLPVPRMSVNVSARRLVDPLLPQKLECLQKAPGEFAFELLESVFLDTHDEQLAANLACIRGMGIDIEVDDFGTGHASIVGLLRLKPNRLKIDRELVGPVDKSDTQRLLIKSIVEIGKLQGIGVVAEGVETPAHIDVLRDLGCDHLQGYGLAKPMPKDQLTALLHAAQSHGKYSPYGGRPPVL